MRVTFIIIASVVVSLAATNAAVADPAYIRLSTDEISAILHQAKPVKPGASSSVGNDTCQWANDLECDEPDIGTGACRLHTDASDCRLLREGENDSCEWARDGECDEPGLGTGVCLQGSDRTDCAGVAALRFRDDSCASAFNGVCEEPGGSARSSLVCEARTDRADCAGRKRPMTINDHFQGFDDRQILATDVYPWTAIGQVDFDYGSQCTASLVAPDVLITAAHCVHDEDGKVEAAGVFHAGYDRPEGAAEARVTAFFVSPRFNPDLFDDTNKLDGSDWAFLKINRPLDDVLGVLAIAPLSSPDGVVLDQAGYSWDTEGHLSGHLGCRLVAINLDETLEHECDTTQGDSGSPIMVVRDGVYTIVAVDSKYRSSADGPPTNVAASAHGFARHLEEFRAGTVGASVVPARTVKDVKVND